MYRSYTRLTNRQIVLDWKVHASLLSGDELYLNWRSMTTCLTKWHTDWKPLYIIAFYHIKYGVIQGFRALKKAVQHTRYNIVFFQVCLISPISCRHVTRISRHSVSLMNERWSLHHPQSKVVCRNFFGITAAKTLKNPYHLQTVTIKLLKKGKKTKIRKEKPKAIRIQWLW